MEWSNSYYMKRQEIILRSHKLHRAAWRRTSAAASNAISRCQKHFLETWPFQWHSHFIRWKWWHGLVIFDFNRHNWNDHWISVNISFNIPLQSANNWFLEMRRCQHGLHDCEWIFDSPRKQLKWQALRGCHFCGRRKYFGNNVSENFVCEGTGLRVRLIFQWLSDVRHPECSRHGGNVIVDH